jgi:two-component system cell cycle response regulator
MMLDIDFFKSINDNYGHDAGDDVLREFAVRVRKSIRGIDLACRYGGEEFVIVMPETDLHVAGMVAERLRRAIAGESFAVNKGTKRIDVTTSIGLSTLEIKGEDIADVTGPDEAGPAGHEYPGARGNALDRSQQTQRGHHHTRRSGGPADGL